MIYRYAQASGYNTEDSAALDGYADADKVSGYARDAMMWAVGAGLINGREDGLVPQGEATRAEVAAIMTRFCKNNAVK